MRVSPTLNIPQAQFLALHARFRAFVGGYGSGKTWAIGAAQCAHYWKHPGANLGYFAPTYPQIRDIFYPTIGEVAADWGLRVQIAEANKEVAFYAGSVYRGTTICRTMDRPESIVGFKIARGSVDEIDTLPIRKADQAWRKIIARLRLNFEGPNGVDVGTTPEGFRFVYRQWVKAPRDNAALAAMYGMVQASTYDNETNLPPGYIESLLATYPANLVQAYLHGQFVNLTSGTVYHAFCRKLNACDDTIGESEPLFVGMDFNVGKMAAIVHVKRDGSPRAVAEIVGAYDTPDMIRRLKDRFEGHSIRVYPDASGGSRKSVNASETDIQLLKAAQFHVSAPAANPPIKDRVNSMNAMFCSAQNARRYLVNTEACPVYTEHLEQQIWDEAGEPDKRSGTDHTNDAAGYFIHHDYPLVRPVRILNLRQAM